MAKGSCQPGEENAVTLVNGPVSVHAVWGGDAASAFPECSGLVTSVRLVNQSANDWVLELPAGTRGAQTLLANTDRTVTNSALTDSLGAATYTHLRDLRLRRA